MSKVQVTIERITPEMALAYLKHNTENRVKSQASINYIAKCIQEDEFFVTPNGIGFNEAGRLIDGQHRLEAIVKAGKPCDIAVFRNVSDGAYVHIDTGRKKTVSDRLHIDKDIGAIVNFIFHLCASTGGGRVTPTPSEVQHVYTRIRDVFDLFQKKNSTVKYFSKAPVKAAAVVQIIMNEGKAEKIADVFDSLMSLDGANEITKVWLKILHTDEKVLKGEGPDRLFARALYAFDPENANKKIMTQKKIDDSTPRYLEDARKVMRRYLQIA